MNRLLKLSTLIEGPTGLGLIAVPSLIIRLLLGRELIGAGHPLAQVAGVALLALSVACWLASTNKQNCAVRGMVTAMGVYNLGTVLVLGLAGFQSQPTGILLWPVVILHAVMTGWCITSLRRRNLQL